MKFICEPKGTYTTGLKESIVFQGDTEEILSQLPSRFFKCCVATLNPTAQFDCWQLGFKYERLETMDLLIELKNLIEAFDKNKIDYALCGGLALAVYARPRATLDIDIMVEPDLLGNVKQIVENLGFNVPATPMSFKDGAVQIHRMTKIDEESGEHMVLDLLLVTPL